MSNIVEIPQYSYDEFLKSDVPYEWLYQHHENKFLLKQLVEQMKRQAGALGVTGFIAMWNAYCKSVTEKQGVSFDESTQFTGQEMELFSGQYKCDDTGVYITDKFGYETNVCCHPIMPIQRLCNADTGEERLKIAYKKGKHWRYVIVEKSVIASSNKILELAANGVVVNSENAKALSTFLLEVENLNFDTIPERNSISRLGWIGEKQFAPYIGDLIFDGENTFKNIFSAVKSCGDRQKWIDAMLKVRAEKSVARFALAASFASVLIDPCGLLNFFVHFWGGQGTGKSVSLMCAASVWANPKFGEYISTFNSTDVGQEMTASFLNSLPYCIDELQIQASAGIKEFDKMIYKLSEGVGKTRGSKSGGLRKTTTWKNSIITTGEYPIINPNSMGGASARVIEVECADKVYSDLVGLCETIGNNYGFAGKEFIDWLKNTENSFEIVRAIQKGYYQSLLNTDSTDKQAASASVILAADFIVTQFLFKDGNELTVEDFIEIMPKKKDVNVNHRIYEYILELIARNPNKFTTNDYGDYQGEAWGKIQGNHIYIIKSVFDRELMNAGYNSTSFLAWAKRNDLIQTTKDRRTVISRIAGTPTNCICIKSNHC